MSGSDLSFPAVMESAEGRLFQLGKDRPMRGCMELPNGAVCTPSASERSSVSAIMILLILLLSFSAGCRDNRPDGSESRGIIVTSDTILSGMVRSLLPPGYFEISAILPPDQCPGHYDMKLSDIRKVEEADLIVSFRDLPFMEKARDGSAKWMLLDRQDRNWMAPDSYVFGLNVLAGMLAERFPDLDRQIADRRKLAVSMVTGKMEILADEIRRAGILNQPVLASSMQREPLEWMGLHVVGDYGRPESMSLRDVARLSGIGREEEVAMVVDNLQSGPDAGQGIAEALDVPHVVLSNFPSEDGYAATLGANVAAVLAAVRKK